MTILWPTFSHRICVLDCNTSDCQSLVNVPRPVEKKQKKQLCKKKSVKWIPIIASCIIADFSFMSF